MSFPISVHTGSDRKAYSSTSVTFDATLEATRLYLLTVTTAAYITQHATTPVAAAADESTLLAPGTYLIDGALGAKLAIIRATADGEATLSKAKMVR